MRQVCWSGAVDHDEDNVKRPVSFEKGRARGAGKTSVYPFNWRPTSLLIFAVLAFQIAILGGFPAEAQIRERSLSGRVTSPSGTPVPNARLAIKSSTSTDTRSVAANNDGTYSVDDLLPGSYEITASAKGFEDTNATVTISSDSKPVVNLVMRAASAAGAGPGQAGSSTVKGDATDVRDLPLNGRSASDVAALEPGVATARTQTSGQAQRGFGTEMTISGGRPRQNDSRLDGISVNDYSNGPPGSALGVNLGVDAVEQFTVLTSTYPAQNGRSSGGIIGASTRSGTNEFHGSVYEFFRNSALDARNFFDGKKPPFRRNQFGVSLGGPILKDRTYIFGDYEGLRSSTGVTQVDTVPSADARAGRLSTGPITVDPTVLSFVNAFILCQMVNCWEREIQGSSPFRVSRSLPRITSLPKWIKRCRNKTQFPAHTCSTRER